MSDMILGAGGVGGKGGGSSYTPSTTRDGLDSVQYASVIDLISEGEIQGLKDGHKSIYINNTQLQNADNTYNFQNVSVYTTTGTQTQAPIPISNNVESEVGVGTSVIYGLPVIKSITNPNVDAVRITISIPQLQGFTDQGDIIGASVQLQIAVQYVGGGFTTVIDDTITGRSGDLYQKDYLIDFTGSPPVDIRVTRVTVDSTDPKLTNAFSWASYTEITNARLRYPNSALVGLRIDAEQFSSIPSRSYLVRGIKVKIPNNATVDSINGRLIYSGTWNGTFGAAAWTTDPCWILWDLLTSTRYGFGDHIQAASLDKWSFYSASQYASALIDSGRRASNGSIIYEPRFSCNVNIQTQEDAYKLVNDLCSVFRAQSYWSTGSLSVSQDQPKDSSYLFLLANVAEDGFSYQNSSKKTRPTVAVVSYLDLGYFDPIQNKWIDGSRDIAYEAVEDKDGIARNGVITTQVSAFACTSRGQAARIGKWLLYEENNGEIVSFTASIEAGVVVRPGQVIEISDPMRAGSRRGGRISAATTTTITVDDATGLTTANSPTLSVILKDGTVQSRSISSISGKAITVSSAFSSAPNANSIWVFESSDLQTTTWRVLGVQEQDDGISYAVSAIAYNASKYAYIEDGTPLQSRDTTNLNAIPTTPTNLAFTEALYTYQTQVRAKVIASWKPVVGVNQYEVRWRKDKGNWTVTQQPSVDFEVLDITPGTFSFKVYSVNAAGKLSRTALTGSITALGKTAPPSDVSGFTSILDKDLGVTLSWDPITDIDLKHYEIRKGGTDWATATFLTNVRATSYKLGILDPSTTIYRLKAVDTSNSESTNSATRTVTITASGAPTVTHTIQDPVAAVTWTTPSGSYTPDYYELRYGTSFASGTSISKVYGNSFNVPVTWSGSRTFWVAAVDPAGNVGTGGSRVVTISAAAAPTISAAFYGRSCTLTWNAVKGTLSTKFYEIAYGSSYASRTVITSISAEGTGFSVAADWSGDRTFYVTAVDANGNLGTAGSVVATISKAAAPTLSTSFSKGQLLVTWLPIKGTLETAYYEVRRGSTFATASVISKASSTYFSTNIDWTSSARFWVVAVDVNILYGSANAFGTEISVDIPITAPSQPIVSQQVIDNNVLLQWTDATATLPIDTYELRKGATWATATVIGTKSGRFTSVFETASGTYTYWIAGIDTAGNYGTPGSISAIVNQPPDYYQKANTDSTFGGTKSNIITNAGGQLVGVNTSETWQSHFTSRSWTTPQDQITAGYAYYAMPSQTSASYEEEFDAGAVFAGTKVSATLTSTAVAGSTTITPTLRVRGTTGTAATYSQATTTITVTSTAHGLAVGDYVYLNFTTGTATDGTFVVATSATNTFTVTSATSATTSGNVTLIKWTTFAGLNQAYATQFRYYRVRYDFASAGGNDLQLLTGLNVRLDSKLRNDSGTGTANAADSGGTAVNFSISPGFVDVDSISITPLATTAVTAVYSFSDVPNPTQFSVYLFNSSGTRVSGGFSWSARGV
jgi:predicted phage tail protein